MTSRIVNPIENNYLTDKAGNLLPGGTLEFYAAGTSDALAVYSDSALTTSLGSILTADSNGLLPDFHMAAGTEYKCIGKNSSGATQWTRDEIFSADSSVDTRLDALETSVASLGEAGRNVLINGGMRVTRTSTAPSLSTSFQEGVVSDIWGQVSANVSAGILTQGESTDYTSGHYCHFSGVTTTGSANVVTQFRVSSEDAARFVDQPASFKCKVYQDTGGALTYTITLKKANSKDDFSALTTIATSSGDSVSDVTNTAITYSTADMGDCSNGVVVEVSVPANSVTTKNFRITESQLEPSATSTAFAELPFRVEKVALTPETGVFQLSTTSIAAGTTIDLLDVISSNSGYEYYRFVISGMTWAGSADRLGIRVSIDGAAARSTAGDYQWALQELHPSFAPAEARSTGDTGIRTMQTTGSAGSFIDGFVDLYIPTSTARSTPILARITNNPSGASADTTWTTATFDATTDDITGLQFYLYDGASSGFSATGTVKVYGSNVPF